MLKYLPEKNKKHTIELVVDRLVIKEGQRRRLTDSIETAWNSHDFCIGCIYNIYEFPGIACCVYTSICVYNAIVGVHWLVATRTS